MEPNEVDGGDKRIDEYGRLAIRQVRFIDMAPQVKDGEIGPGNVKAFNGMRQQAGVGLDAAPKFGGFMDIPPIHIYAIEEQFADRKDTSGQSLPLELCVVSDFPTIGKSLS